MNKLLVYGVIAGVAIGAGVVYLLCKNKKVDSVSTTKLMDKEDFNEVIKEEISQEEQGTIQDVYVEKEKSIQSVCERHNEATKMMSDSFANIMKDVEPIEVNKKTDKKVIDSKDVEIINELDSLSDELEELLK